MCLHRLPFLIFYYSAPMSESNGLGWHPLIVVPNGGSIYESGLNNVFIWLLPNVGKNKSKITADTA